MDLFNRITLKRVISPVSVSDNTAQVGQIIDHAGYSSTVYGIATGSLADSNATFAVLLEESDDSGMSGAVAVDDAYLIGTETLAGFQYNSDDKCRKLGYKGTKRYTRLTITPSGNADVALIAAVCLLGGGITGPEANPPV